MDQTDHGALKACVAWGGVFLSKLGIHTWSDVAAVLASIYTCFLILEWVWKHFRRRRHDRNDR